MRSSDGDQARVAARDAVPAAAEISLLPGAARVSRAHRDAGAQLDNLCGPYCVWIALSAAGVPTTQDDVAVAAGTLLPIGGDPAAFVPPGESNRDRYTRQIRRTADLAASGTSARGLVAATRDVSGGSFAAVPIRGRGGGPLGEADVCALIAIVESNPSWEAVPIVNLRTGKLWGTSVGIDAAAAFVSGEPVEPPPPEWDVGHFVSVAGAVRGSAGTALIVRDTYPTLGSRGVHVQPAGAVADAIRRDDGRDGGCLLFVSADDAASVERVAKDAGFDIDVWDNGTPYEGGTP